MREILKAYPLQWPTGWKRTTPGGRRRAQFSKKSWRLSTIPGGTGYYATSDLSVADAIGRLRGELGRMGIQEDDVVISTNLALRLDGLPRSDQRQPEDPGAAVYWVDPFSQARRCMAIDRYDLVEHNIAALAATLDAMRAIERHGGAEILDRAFTGFTALPGPMAAARPWRDVLEVGALDATVDTVRHSYRLRRSIAHPDKGGSQAEYLAVQAAYEAAARELGFTP